MIIQFGLKVRGLIDENAEMCSDWPRGDQEQAGKRGSIRAKNPAEALNSFIYMHVYLA